MFKTLTVSIGTVPFVIEEQAYATLERYLRAIHAHFAATADADEIVADIESRMAEEFAAALGKHRRIIESKDVNAVIESMGTIEDFRTFDSGAPESAASPAFQKTRLYRDADNQVLGGVCAGIANYFGMDPVILRLAFGLSIFLGGFGVVLYIVLWIALPEARTTAQKVEMTHGRLTLAALQKKIDDVVPPAKRKGLLMKIIAFPFMVIRVVFNATVNVLKAVLPILARIIGAFATVGATFAIAALTFVLFAMLLNPDSPYIGLPLHGALTKPEYVTLLLSGYFVAFVPALFALLIGISLMTMRSLFSTVGIIALVIVWFAAGTTGATTLFSATPELEPAFAQYEERSEQAYDLADFATIDADGIDRIEVTQGETYEVILIGGQRGLASHQPMVEDGVLSLQRVEDDDPCLLFCLSDHARLRIVMPALVSVSARDAARVTLTGFSGSALTIATQDVGRVEADVTLQTLTITATDVARVELNGSAATLTATLSDITRLEGEEFAVEEAELTMSDMSRAVLDVRQALRGMAKDGSSIRLVTMPASVEVELSDGASLREMNEY
jgi:phage shock protein PspC (stress-responsive transcriptional regulator)